MEIHAASLDTVHTHSAATVTATDPSPPAAAIVGRLDGIDTEHLVVVGPAGLVEAEWQADSHTAQETKTAGRR